MTLLTASFHASAGQGVGPWLLNSLSNGGDLRAA